MKPRALCELERLHASGVHLVATRAPDASPPECLAADETLYTTERALREAPLPHSPACTCFYAPRWWLDVAPATEAA